MLRKKLKTGEIVSNGLGGAATPIVTLADNRVLRVRVDVDETDIGKLQLGQAAYVKAEAFGEQQFKGKVIRIGQVLGKKNVRTEKGCGTRRHQSARNPDRTRIKPNAQARLAR